MEMDYSEGDGEVACSSGRCTVLVSLQANLLLI